MAKFKDKDLKWLRSTNAWVEISTCRNLTDIELVEAIENFDSLLDQDLEINYDNPSATLLELFIWDESEQGDGYWRNLWMKVRV